MPGYEYTTAVITHGLLGRKREEIDREELQTVLNQHGAEGWELEKLVLDTSFHGEKDGHLLIFKRAVA
ncbi:MAG TPA: DUF4177 domain-containing protein [Solirubrobacteraceae bacterium]|jgi:uncharacterized protein DUF4177|nr:DUF4177 domain-containing protein [Solirubrobacteraceae bacterium]